MAAIAGRIAWAGARRYGPRIARAGFRYASKYAKTIARKAPQLARRITPNATRAASSRATGFNTMRGMGSRAFSTGGARGASKIPWKKGMMGAGAAAAAASPYFAKRKNDNKKAEEQATKKQRINQREQHATGDLGDDIRTSDKFEHTTGTTLWKSYQLMSGPMIIKNNTTGGLLGIQGRAVWGYLRYKPYLTTDATLWQTVGGLQNAETDTTVTWRDNNTTTPGWRVGDNMTSQVNFLERKFIFEKSNTQIEFKNQSSSPVHLEYFVVAYGNSGGARDVFNDIKQGAYGTSANVSAGLPTILTVTETGGAMTSNTDFSAGRSSTFKANWNIVYKHKVRMSEGGVHVFNYTNNANRVINWGSILKNNAINSAVETNFDGLKNITYHIIYKIYGELGDNSNLINTVNTAGVTTGDTKIIYRTLCTETFRNCYATPRLVIDKGTDLPTGLANVYEKDGGTGKVDDMLLEVQP